MWQRKHTRLWYVHNDLVNCNRLQLTLYFQHYTDVIMTTMASQITSLAVVYSSVYLDADQRKHQSSASLAFVWGIHRDRWIPRTKGQLRGKCFHLMTLSWIVWHAISISDKYIVYGYVTWAPLRFTLSATRLLIQKYQRFINWQGEIFIIHLSCIKSRNNKDVLHKMYITNYDLWYSIMGYLHPRDSQCDNH